MLRLPADIYPNPPQQVCGAPALVFRDHRWTLPAIFAAAGAGLLTLPVTIVSFDRHRDSLSARDDDWIPAGMELGILGDVVQFGIDDLAAEEAACSRRDAAGSVHRQYRLSRPPGELSWKGALADPAHPAATNGLWDALGWNADARTITPRGDLVLDIDLDAFTFSWERYTFPYAAEIWEGEYLRPVQSQAGGAYTPGDFVRALADAAGLITIATEPGFCGGADNAGCILEDVNRYLFGGALDTCGLVVDYTAKYPDE